MKVQIWFVDCQKDFINADGALPVPFAENILDNLAKLRIAATVFDTPVVYTQDLHAMHDAEFSDTPDYSQTFPRHCVAGTPGAELVGEVGCPEDVAIIEPSCDLIDILQNNEGVDIFEGDVILTKQIFSTFDGNKNAEAFVEATAPDVVFICGVAGDVCVKHVVNGFHKLNELNKQFGEPPIKVGIVHDAIKSIDREFGSGLNSEWENWGFEIVDALFVESFLALTNRIGDTL